MLELWHAIQKPDLLDLILLQENAFEKPALVHALDLGNPLNAANEFFQVREVGQPVNLADVVETEVDDLHRVQLRLRETHRLTL
jgi:hypothetical protein